MSKITTDDCKEFLISHYTKQGIATTAKEWKRASKYKQDGLDYRDFTHPQLDTVIVVENNGILSIGGQAPNAKATTTKPVQQIGTQKLLSFSTEDTKGALRLLKKYLNNVFEDDDFNEEKFMSSQEWEKYAHAFPSLFNFSFPAEDYDNLSENITNGLDSPVVSCPHKSINSFNFILYPKDKKIALDYESSHDIFQLYDLGDHSFTQQWDFLDETHIGLRSESLNAMTVRELIQNLLRLGFEYNESPDEKCLFDKEIKAELKICAEQQLLNDTLPQGDAKLKTHKAKI